MKAIKSGLLFCILFSLSACDLQFNFGGGIATKKAETLISESLSDKAGKKVTVTCPADVKEKKGETFTCKATAEGDPELEVVVTMRGDGNIDWEAKLAGPLKLEQAWLQTTIGEPLSAKSGGPVAVSCPADVVEVVDGTFNCTATADDGTSAVVQVTMHGGGSIDWAVVSSPVEAEEAPVE